MRTWPAIVVSGATMASDVNRSHDAESGVSRIDVFHAALSDYPVAAVDEPDDTLRAFFNDPAERDRAITALRAEFPDLQLTAVDVPDEDWAARSQANLTAIRVGQIIVAPPWDADRARLQSNETLVVIQPSMGFGTGHHATTRLCLAALQRANVRGRSVIDVGTGSGVLAIAASLLGASPVLGIDDDPDAIQSAQENVALNPEAAIELRLGDLRTSTPGVADVVLANLTGTLLVHAAPQLQTLVPPRGRLIVSGLLLDEEADVIAAFPEMVVLDGTQEDEWGCVVLARPGVFA